MKIRCKDIIEEVNGISGRHPFLAGIRKGFIKGAKLVDSNPRNVYVVMRQEEHSDYIEKVFISKSKAESYCKQFNEKKNEYSRYYEEMEVSL